MSLFAPCASLVTSAALRSPSERSLGGSPRTKAYLSPGSAGTDRERMDWSGVPTGALRTHLSPGQAHGFLITLPAGDGLRRRGGALRALLRVTGRRCKYVAVAR